MKYLFGMFCVLLFSGCDIAALFKEPIEIPKFENDSEIGTWIMKNIEYKSDFDSEGFEEWFKLPAHTLRDKTGDCDDLVILWLQIYKEQFGNEGFFVAVEADGYGGHCYAESEKNEPKFYYQAGYPNFIGRKTLDEILLYCH